MQTNLIVYTFKQKYIKNSKRIVGKTYVFRTRVNTLATSFNFPSPQTKTCQFLPCFFLPKPRKIFMAYLKFLHFWHKIARKAANGARRRKYFTTLHVILQKKLKLTIKRKNREEIYQKQGKYLWITGKLTDYQFLPCFFPSWRFWPKYLLLI